LPRCPRPDLSGGRTWLHMRDGFGLSGIESGPLVAWALHALLDEVRRGNPPRKPQAHVRSSRGGSKPGTS
jgi:hypothetical protein